MLATTVHSRSVVFAREAIRLLHDVSECRAVTVVVMGMESSSLPPLQVGVEFCARVGAWRCVFRTGRLAACLPVVLTLAYVSLGAKHG